MLRFQLWIYSIVYTYETWKAEVINKPIHQATKTLFWYWFHSEDLKGELLGTFSLARWRHSLTLNAFQGQCHTCQESGKTELGLSSGQKKKLRHSSVLNPYLSYDFWARFHWPNWSERRRSDTNCPILTKKSVKLDHWSSLRVLLE